MLGLKPLHPRYLLAIAAGSVMVLLSGSLWIGPAAEPGLATVALLGAGTMLLLGGLALRRAWLETASAKRTLEEAIEALPASVEIFDESDRLVAFNRHLLEIYPHMSTDFKRGVRFEELVRKSIAQGGVPAAKGCEEEWLAQRLAARAASRKSPAEPLLQNVHEGRWVRIHERHTRAGGIIGVRMDVSDLIHEQQRLAASKAHLQAFVRTTPNGVLTLDVDGHVLALNPAAEALFGFAANELVGSHIDLLFGIWMGARLSPQALVASPQEMTARHRDGQEMTLLLSVAEVKTETAHSFVCIITDLSERKRQEVALQEANAQLAKQSITDGLTGVGNRRYFDQLLQQEWQRSARHGHPLACIMVDIDHFKLYNDRYGHVAGDECLIRVAELLRACAGRSGEAVCRYGGEEFVLLLADCDLAGAQVVAQRCLDSIRLAAIEHEASPLRRKLSLSLGVAACVASPQGDAVSLVEHADAALYAAKQNGRARLVCSEQAA
ncbi:sensor domain-containing diguanylate cyclase [Roseateles oligotrophus]|uniref:diguanylate cyclase n=1 Tax=Roseateles oligotrophus TaxID=1769250 RepID=A0ABT2YMC3_9BURK|nr:diguanylate cyclase [Roseateles oligotrophus]MCV2371157.1 diguanylate cyclase [Roseateles oligotrophus]